MNQPTFFRLTFRLACQWCGTINVGEVPAASKEGMSAECIQCKKFILQFRELKDD